MTEQQEKCKACRECCEYVEVPTSMLDLNALEYWILRGEKFYITSDGVLHVRFYKPCDHLKEDGCDIYDTRPYTCRIYMCHQKDSSVKALKERYCENSMSKTQDVIDKYRKEEQEKLQAAGEGK